MKLIGLNFKRWDYHGYGKRIRRSCTRVYINFSIKNIWTPFVVIEYKLNSKSNENSVK